MRPGVVSPTNQDLADIWGGTDFDFDNLILFFVWSQNSGFPGSKIFRFTVAMWPLVLGIGVVLAVAKKILICIQWSVRCWNTKQLHGRLARSCSEGLTSSSQFNCGFCGIASSTFCIVSHRVSHFETSDSKLLGSFVEPFGPVSNSNSHLLAFDSSPGSSGRPPPLPGILIFFCISEHGPWDSW